MGNDWGCPTPPLFFPHGTHQRPDIWPGRTFGDSQNKVLRGGGGAQLPCTVRGCSPLPLMLMDLGLARDR